MPETEPQIDVSQDETPQKEEKIYYSSSGVLITESKAILSGKSHKIAEIESPSMSMSLESLRDGIIFGAIGIIVTIIGIAVGTIILFLGLAFLLIGIVYLIRGYSKKVYCVRFDSFAGKVTAYKSSDSELVKAIVDALGQAIIDREMMGKSSSQTATHENSPDNKESGNPPETPPQSMQPPPQSETT